MKYWLLTTAYNSAKDTDIGVYVKEHANIFAANGHEVLIIHGGKENTDSVTRISDNISLHAFSLNGRESTKFMGADAALSFEFANEVIKLLAKNSPDVIEVQDYLGIGYYLLIRKYAGEPLLANIPVIVTTHIPSFIIHEYNHSPVYRFPQYWTGEMEKFSILAADLLASPNRQLTQLLKERMPEAFPKQAHFIPYPFEAKPYRGKMHLSPEEQVCSSENYYSIKYKIVTDLIAAKTSHKNFPVLRPQPKQVPASQPPLEDGLTIAIPFYNMGAFVGECIESVLASSYKNIKIIIVDDGSTDTDSITALEDIQNKYPAIDIIRQPNGGLSTARNTGLLKARSKYIIFLDPDDTVHPGYFERCIRILHRYDNIGFVSCWLNYFGAEEGIWPAQNPEVPYLLYHNTVHSGCLFKTFDILQTGGYDRSLVYGMEDYEMAIHMVSKGYHGFTIPEALYNYRIRKQSMARGFTDDKKLYLYTLIAQKHKALFDKYGAESCNILNANGPGYMHDNPTFPSRFTIKAAAPAGIRRAVIEAVFNKYPRLHKLSIRLRSIIKS